MSDVMTERPLDLPDDLVWSQRKGGIYYLEIKENGIEIMAFFVPTNRTYAWYQRGIQFHHEKSGPEYATDGDRAPQQRLDIWMASEVFDKLSGHEIDRWVSLAVENEIRRCYAWNDFPGWFVEKR